MHDDRCQNADVSVHDTENMPRGNSVIIILDKYSVYAQYNYVYEAF